MGDNRFLDALEQRVLLGSGAMGTEFLRRGCLPGRPLDELNLTRPHLVLDLSREYMASGAELIKTNTFLANRVRLKRAGLGDRTREINLAGAQLAREAAKGAFVAGCVGPLSDLGVTSFLAYREQCLALKDGGCDVILFETFSNSADLSAALKAGWSTGLPLVCQASVPSALTGLGDCDVTGVNCISPGKALIAIQELKIQGRGPLSAFPSGGVPGEELTLGEFANSIKILISAGVRLVGGCCGAGPAHIAAAAAVLGKGR